MHLYFAVIYGVISLPFLYELFSSFGKGQGGLIEMTVFSGIFILWAFAHYKASDAVETGKNWASGASYFLAVPLLLGIPIGTFFGIRMIMHARKLNRE